MDGAARLWNELNYERRQRFFSGDDVWPDSGCYDEYKGLLGATTVQAISRVNDEAWRSFFAKRKNHKASPPGYWGNETDGRDLRVYIGNRDYTLRWGTRSRIEILIGQDLKKDYGLGYHFR